MMEEPALRDSEATFQAVIDVAPDLLLVHRDGRVLCVNTTARAALGYGREETVASRRLLDLVHPEDHARLASHLEGLTSPRGRGPSREIRLLRSGGELLPAEIISAPVRFAGQAAIVSSARDITERKQAQVHHLQKDRLTALGALAAGVAHEMGNPLTYVLHNLDLVARSLGARADDCRSAGAVNGAELAAALDELAAALGAARQGTERAQRITRDLATFARGGDQHRSLLDVRAVLKPVLHLVSNEIQRRARLVEDFQAVPLISANEAQLGQVFVNLLVNATQAISEGRAGEHEITVSTETDASGRAVVEVRDTGAGIPEEALRRVFEPFFRARPGSARAGLGLSICHGTVTALGGEISVRSECGRGSVFRVAIPPSDGAIVSSRSSTPLSAARARARILLVDDEPQLGEILGQTLVEHEFYVLSEAREALVRILDGDQFDVILCKLIMPIMTGMDLHAELSRSAPGQADRIVFITGGACTDRARTFLARIPNVRMEKPPSPDELEGLIQGARKRLESPCG
ncbi:MAG: ATP-binding protein [Byssovorax sp.]